MIEIYALKAEYNPYFQQLFEKYPCCSTKINPIERNSLYSKILIEYCSRLGYKHTNLSHSGIWCVCCCGNTPCGIDIEKKREIPEAMIPEGFSKDPSVFLKEWTKVESCLKYRREGLRDVYRYDLMDFTGVRFQSFNQIDGYEICSCTGENEQIASDIHILNIIHL